MDEHPPVLQIYLKNTGRNRGKQNFLPLLRLHHVDVIGPCLQYICQNPKPLLCIIKNLQVYQIHNKIFIFPKGDSL